MSKQSYEENLLEQMHFLFHTTSGKELQLCFVAQGYESRLFDLCLMLFGSLFTAYDIIKNVKRKLNE